MSVLGTELVINGDFAVENITDEWTYGSGWSWSAIGEYATAPTGGTTGALTQTLLFTAGKTYSVSYNATLDSNILYGQLGGQLFTVSEGANTVSVVAGNSDSLIHFAPEENNTGGVVVDDVSVKELSTADKIEKAVFDILRLDSTVSALVSSRIYPEIVPQNTSFPALYYTQIAGPRQHTLASTDNMVPSRWQFTVIADTYAELRGISDAVRGALDSYSGTAGTVVIQCAHMIDENDLTDVLPGTDKLRKYTKAIDFNIWYNE